MRWMRIVSAFESYHQTIHYRDYSITGIPEVNNPLFARLRLIAIEKTQQTMYTPLQLWNDNKGYRIPQPDLQLTQIIIDETKED
uniref:Uncharacterized protein n=1 Tax=Caenorhabditis japonica TaxID=281687 RepID=A0A8R1E7D5_CAEJA